MFADVVVNRPLWTSYTYLLPPDVSLDKGSFGVRVKVSLGHRDDIGWIVRLRDEGSLDINVERIKMIKEVVDSGSPLPRSLEELVEWVGEYYFSPLGMILATVFPPTVPPVMGSARDRTPDEDGNKPVVFMNRKENRVDAYVEMIKEELDFGRQVIVMLPDKNLINYVYERLRDVIPESVIAVWTASQVRRNWLSVRDGSKRVVLGSRSVVFAPTGDLGLIIVDEEASESYWQSRVPFYNARDVAIKRASIQGCKVVLGDSVPLVETVFKAAKGFYVFDKRRGSKRPRLGRINIVDMRTSNRKGVISSCVVETVERVLRKGGQSILLVNRKGYAGFIICGDCGFVPKCPNCSVSLTFYKERTRELRCNYCGYTESVPNVCPVCGGTNWLTYSAGVEQVYEVLATRFPNVNTAYIDSTLKKREIVSVINAFKENKVKILVSTVLFLSYLIDYQVENVSVVYADGLFNMPDFRSGERSFRIFDRLLEFVKDDGQLILQTFNPTYPIVRFFYAQQKWRFYRYELANRKELSYPPFSYIAVIEIKGREDNEAKSVAEGIHAELSRYDISVLGPVRPIPSKLRGYYRWRLVLKDVSWTRLHDLIKEKYYDILVNEGKIRVTVIVDPLMVD